MFGIGPQELIIVALIALVVLGPRRLPQMAREVGHFVREARSSIEEFREELDSEEDDEEDDEEELDSEEVGGEARASEEDDEVRRGAKARKKNERGPRKGSRPPRAES